MKPGLHGTRGATTTLPTYVNEELLCIPCRKQFFVSVSFSILVYFFLLGDVRVRSPVIYEIRLDLYGKCTF